MRIHTEADLRKVRQQMLQAVFRLKDDEGIVTAKEMAQALGISKTHLRHHQRGARGRAPSHRWSGTRQTGENGQGSTCRICGNC